MRPISTGELLVVSISIGIVAGMLVVAFIILTGRWAN